VAWVGVVAVIGLIVCVVAELRELRIRRKERSLPEGEVYTPKWSGLRLGLVGGGGVACLVGLAFAVSALIGGGSTGKLKVAPTTTTVTTVPPIIASTTTTAPLGPARAPQLVRVDVLNASGVPRAATLKAQGLAAAGYRITFTGNAATQAGTFVECKDGFAAEAVALARVVGPGTLVQGFPSPAPLGSTNADCVVLLGQ
jgi:LytR cell envelope-related transcriptional attenuator